jgi:hypothetical protein
LIFFAKKRLFQIKTAITFAYELGKNCVIYEKLSTQKVTSDFNDHKLFAQNLAPQYSEGKYESMKILDFARKMRKKIQFILLFLIFLIILKFLYYFGILEFFSFL